MNILITRPLMESEDLISKLFSMGHKIVHLPTLKISPAPNISIDTKEFDAFIFTSANSVRNLNLLNEDKKIFCFCVGAMTERVTRKFGFLNTISAGGSVLALKNLIMNSNRINKNSKLAYFCSDHISHDLEKDLKREGFKIRKIINYFSEKINNLSNESKNLIQAYPPNLIFIYSSRSAESFIEIVKNYSLYPLMTESKVMCISKKVKKVFELEGWKKIEIFNPGDEILKLEQ